MIPQEVIDGLKLIKEWDPRPFILDICDAAIVMCTPLVGISTPAVAAEPVVPATADPVAVDEMQAPAKGKAKG